MKLVTIFYFYVLVFLEWSEHVNSSKKRLAPLYLIPITITKEYTNGIAVNVIKYTSEDILPNLILEDKLKQDFDLTLPSIISLDNEDKLLSPEKYFSEIISLIERKNNDLVVSGWKVRRYATLATLSLGKLLMYKDLDPNNWPDNESNILQHEVIKRFFYDGKDKSTVKFINESYLLDDIKKIHENFPMIEDADSSQMSVLIDVLNGKNLVVEGPPGTGKSQTITNIISAALSQGKTVLFIAEKQAALEVVKRRMDKAGLGDFCLNLHSDKVQKRIVLDSFKQRISNAAKFKYSELEYAQQVERYERARERLQNYVLLINRQWKSTGLTIHEILMAATRYANEISNLSYKDVALTNFASDNFNKRLLDEKLEQLELFYNYLDIVVKQLPDTKNWSSHPWFGIENKNLMGEETKELIDILKRWNHLLLNWSSELSKQCESNQIPFSESIRYESAKALVNSWSYIPKITENVDVSAIKKLMTVVFLI